MAERKAENTILIVNDAPDQLDMASFLLRQSGYNVLTARNGREGFELAQAEHPDLIISDVSMPLMDGIEMCSLIREQPDLSMIPIILVSAVYKDSPSVVEGLMAGADDYLEAPYDPMRLVTKVAQFLKHKRAVEALRQSEEHYRLLFESNPHPMWVYDLETLRFLTVNEAAIHHYGSTREDSSL